jgi:hypothetical protein
VAPAGAHGGPRLCQAARRRALAAERNDRTLDEYRERLAERSGGSKVSRPTLCRALRRLGLRRKKRRCAPSEQERAEIQQERAVFCEQVRQLDAKDLVFIDETGSTRPDRRDRIDETGPTRPASPRR